MNPLLASAAAGALAMYFLDPQAGRRRRVRSRDKAQRAARKLQEAYDVTLRDTRQRAMGIRALSQRMLHRGRGADDATVVGRVRACLGRYVSHPHAIEASVREGRVTLQGPILAAEVPAFLKALARVRGVRELDNRLSVHKEAGNIPALQGGRRRTGRRFELLQDNWSPAARLAVGSAGLLLYLRGGILGRLGGIALMARAASNIEFAPLLGLGAPDNGIEVQKTICVNAPVDQVFAFWSDYQNFPRFMSRVREVRVVDDRSHWVVQGPAGVPIEWISEVVAMEPNERIEWRSTADSAVKQAGCVYFEEAEGGTRVTVQLCYLPPAGALGHAVAALFGADPKSEMDADLMRMKSAIETGKAPHDAAQRA